MGELDTVPVKENLVIGCIGQVGKAVGQVLLETYGESETGFKDLYNKNEKGKYKAIHICIPYKDESFIQIVEEYKKLNLVENGLVIIHSTVPIGTCDKLGAVHSPIRGLHPNLYSGVKTFVKLFGGKRAYEAAKIFEACQIKTKVFTNSKDVEASKLFDTTRFGWDIMMNKIIYKYCEENNLNFEIVWTFWNQSYNDGYYLLKKPQYLRPWFDHVPGKMGGTCIMPNLNLLDSEIVEFMKKFNDSL